MRRVRAEFDELRGLKLTLPQAERLFGLRTDVCLRVFDDLVGQGLLRRTSDRAYARKL